jgi:hypothetical protein
MFGSLMIAIQRHNNNNNNNVTYSGSIDDGTLMHSKTQYTTLDYSSQLLYSSNTSITATDSLI